jgi:hypothetical protein
MSIIVVEGTDGSGKSTLIERARENQSSRYFIKCQASRYQPDLKTAFQYLNWLKRAPEIDLILDRFHFISDRVYGPVLRNEDVFQNLPLNFGLQGVGAIVYCRPSTDRIVENVNKDIHLKGVREHIETLIQRYDTLMARLHNEFSFRIFTYDYEIDEPVSFWRHVFAEARELEAKVGITQAITKAIAEKKHV